MDTKINETVEMQTRDNLMEAGDLSTNGVPPKPQPKGLLSRTWARRDGIPLRDKPPPGGTITNTQNGRYQLGNAVQGERDMDQWNRFVTYNTFTMILSLAIVLVLISGFPLRNKFLMWLLTIATLFTVVFMVATYLQSLGMMAPDMYVDVTSVWGCDEKERSAFARSDCRHQGSYEKEIEVQPMKHHHMGTSSRETGEHSESKDSEGGHWKSKSRRHSLNTYEDDLSQPWTCEERNPFTRTLRIRIFNFPRTKECPATSRHKMKRDPEDH
ncbi:ankyrin repeat-containing protein ITN1-like protein [Tanacetum coccineum]